MIAIIPLLILTGVPAVNCLPVAGDRIRARDMTRALPVFAGLAPDLPLGYTPPPGGHRVYSAAELTRLGRRYGLAISPGLEACFVRSAEALTRERVVAALAKIMPGTHLEVLDFSHQQVPPGELRFDKPPLAGGDVLCKGWVSQGGSAGFPVWALVRVRRSGTRAVAAENLSPGVPIALSQLRIERDEGHPGLDPALVVGHLPRQVILAGTPVESRWLEEATDVRRGERVRVEVSSGPARLTFEGEAQAAGQRGQVIPVRNPSNGRIIRATVAGRGSVVLKAGMPDRRPQT